MLTQDVIAHEHGVVDQHSYANHLADSFAFGVCDTLYELVSVELAHADEHDGALLVRHRVAVANVAERVVYLIAFRYCCGNAVRHGHGVGHAGVNRHRDAYADGDADGLVHGRGHANSHANPDRQSVVHAHRHVVAVVDAHRIGRGHRDVQRVVDALDDAHVDGHVVGDAKRFIDALADGFGYDDGHDDGQHYCLGHGNAQRFTITINNAHVDGDAHKVSEWHGVTVTNATTDGDCFHDDHEHRDAHADAERDGRINVVSHVHRIRHVDAVQHLHAQQDGQCYGDRNRDEHHDGERHRDDICVADRLAHANGYAHRVRVTHAVAEPHGLSLTDTDRHIYVNDNGHGVHLGDADEFRHRDCGAHCAPVGTAHAVIIVVALCNCIVVGHKRKDRHVDVFGSCNGNPDVHCRRHSDGNGAADGYAAGVQLADGDGVRIRVSNVVEYIDGHAVGVRDVHVIGLTVAHPVYFGDRIILAHRLSASRDELADTHCPRIGVAAGQPDTHDDGLVDAHAHRDPCGVAVTVGKRHP